MFITRASVDRKGEPVRRATAHRRHRMRVLAVFLLTQVSVAVPILEAGTRAASASVSPGEIQTIAGNGTSGTSGDGSAATSANLNNPNGTVVDAAGDIYVADSANNRIQEIAANTGTQWGIAMIQGDIYTIAGSSTGSSGTSGNGGVATSALLDAPTGLALDSSGDLFIADSVNNRIQELPVSTHVQFGISMTADDIYTVAGSATGAPGYSGDSGAATSALLSGPREIALDSSNNLFIADSENNRIQEVPTYSGNEYGQSMTTDDIYTVAGSSSGTSGHSGDAGAASSALLSGPVGVYVDPSRDVYVADTANNRIQEIAASSGTQWGVAMTAADIYTVVGSSSGGAGTSGDGGGATGALLQGPRSVALDPAGDVYVADSGNSRLQELVAVTGTQWGIAVTAGDVYTVAGSPLGITGYAGDGGPAALATFDDLAAISIDSTGDLFLSDTTNQRIREVTPATVTSNAGSLGDVETIIGHSTTGTSGDGGAAQDGKLNTPFGTVVDSAGNVYIADKTNNRIQEIAAISHEQWGISMSAGDVYTIAGSATGSAGSTGDGGAATSALLHAPTGVFIDAAGNLYIADSGNNRVQFLAGVSCSSSCPFGLASTTANDVYTVAGSSTGSSGIAGDGGAATSALLHTPTGVSLDGAGDLYVADSMNNRIEEVAASSGTQWGVSMSANDIYTVAGSATGGAGSGGDGNLATSAFLDVPYNVAFDASGDMYIADYNNSRVQEVAASSGTQRGVSMTANHVYTIAGSSSGSYGATGDGGAATSAKLFRDTALAFDPLGNLYIADMQNNRVQEVAIASGTQWGQSMTANDIYTVAGSSSGSSGNSGDGGAATAALFHTVSGVALAPSGAIYVVDQANEQVRTVLVSANPPYQFNPNDVGTLVGTGTSGHAGDNGQAAQSQLSFPYGVTVDSSGNIYVADTDNNRVQETAATAHTQWGISMIAGNTYTIAGSATGTSGSSGDGGAATSALLFDPFRLVLDPSGDLYIADSGNNRIQEIAATSRTQWGVSMTANDIYTVAGSASGTSGDSGDSGAATSALFNAPQGLALDNVGDLLISDAANNQVRLVAQASCSSSCPFGLASTTAADVYTIAGSTVGTSGSTGDGGAAASALLSEPEGLVVDPSGDLYIADALNNRVQYISSSSCSSSCPWGLASTTAGDVYTLTTRSLDTPNAVALDSTGDLYITDSYHNQIVEVAASTGSDWGQSMTAGDSYVIAGTGTSGYSGDGGVATSSTFALPMDFAFDPNGNLYVADQGNSVIRELASSGVLLANSGPNQPGETTGGSNPSEAIAQSPSTSPGNAPGTGASVDSMTGELDVSVPDDSIPGRGIAVSLTRSYSSAQAGQIFSPLGKGWTDSYNMAVAADPTDGASVEDVYQPNGSVTRFVENASGGYAAPSRVQAMLVHNGDGTWTYVSGATQIFTFNSSGQLTAESDPNGLTTSLAYATYDGASVLSAVTDLAGRTLTFTYEAVDGYAVVQQVEDSGSRTVQYGYNTSADLTSVTDVGGGTTDYTYDSADRLATIKDSLGNTTTFSYNNANQVVTAVDPLSHKTTWTYALDTTKTGTTTITDPLGINTIQNFTDGELVSETDAAGTADAATTNFGYYSNTAGVKLVTDPNGHVTRYVYDQNGNLLAKTNPLGATWSYAYNGFNEQVGATTPLGETTTSTYDTKGNLLGTARPIPTGGTATTSDGYGATSSCSGAQTHDLTSTTDALGKTTYYCYDSYGDQSSVTDPAGNETTSVFNVLGEKTSTVSPRGNVAGGTPANFTTSYTYDAYGNVTKTVDPLGDTTKATYDYLSNKLTSTDANSNVTTYSYDADNELTGVAEPGGSCSGTVSLCTSYIYDADGNKASMTDPRGKTTDYTYDSLGRLLTSTDPNSHETSYIYDLVGNELTVTDPNSDVTKSVYNAANELTSQTSGYGTGEAVTQSFTYDADGNKTSFSNGASNETDYVYNLLDQLISTTDPMANVTSYTYNSNGQTSTVTNPDAVVETYSYYDNGQVHTTSYSGGSAPTVTYTYNADGGVATMADASGTSTYAYNDADRVTSYENGKGTTISYGYDNAGNVTVIGYPGASHTVTNAYNALGEMTSVTDWSSNETQFTYNADASVSGITYPNSIATSTTYDNANQLSSITDTNTSTSSTVASMSYTRDNANLVTAESDTGLPTAPSSFGYNALKELTSAGASSYTYNSAENLTTSPIGATQAFNANSETCWSGSGSGTCSSPPSGATTYGYSAEGNRTSATPSSGTSYTYGYDATNALTSVTPSPGSATSYVYDGNGLLQSETTSSATTNYTWNPNGSLPLLLADATNYYVYGPGSITPIEQINISTGAVSYLLSDQLGSVRAITDSSGNVTATLSFDAWGNSTGTTGSATTPFTWAGAYLDPSNDFYYLRARWYDSPTGQFMSLDAKVATTFQPYSYAGNDPVNGADPSGLRCHTRACSEKAARVIAARARARDRAPTSPVSGPFFAQPGSVVSSFADPPIPARASAPAQVAPSAPSVQTAGPKSMTQVSAASWATTQSSNCDETYAGYQDCSSTGIARAGGYFGCAVTSAGGGCFDQWVAVGTSPRPQDHIGGAWWIITVTAGATGCIHGAALGYEIGGPPGAAVGCVIIGTFEGGLDLLLHSMGG